jgi:ATP-dependent DNA helicase RecG
VPTGILAKQHYELISKLLPNAKIVFLTGSQKTKNALKIIQNENCIIVGTHALLQSKVKYKNLGLLVVDEQHRFGVLQRMLVDKGMQYNVLLMTATPIPRTLKLSFMGYIPVSKILTRPQNHKDIKTEICSMSHIEQLIDSVKNAIENEDSVFWVCPNIEEENKRGGMSVYTRGKLLEEHFPNLTGILHGKMTENEKDAVLNKFLNKEIKILISTTVIEVGVNIPHANIIIIDNSEYFGMAQLYQLMGRVGRGSVYLTYGSLSSETKMRLMALKECKQGLDLAEKDMYIRGFGNLLGEEQSGDSTQCFKCLDVFNDAQILIEAREMVHKNINNQAFCEMLDKKSEIFACLKESWTAG